MNEPTKTGRIREATFAIVVALLIVVGLFHFFTTTIDETGFLGMNKDGRQILIQTMNKVAEAADPAMEVTSDWGDYSLLQRLWQEPMRTTIRIYTTVDKKGEQMYMMDLAFCGMTISQSVESVLQTPYGEFLSAFDQYIYLSEDDTISIEELKVWAENTGVVTMRDLLRGFGFTNYERYMNGYLLGSVNLNSNVHNEIQGNFISRGGSQTNCPLPQL